MTRSSPNRQPMSAAGLAESLAGRVTRLRLLPLSLDLEQYQLFPDTLAARSGQFLNLSELSRDLGIAVNTAKRWLSVLEATFQVVVLRSSHA